MRWKWLLWAGISVFLLTRLLALTSFPIFNDEAIYIQYSQVIHHDFGQYRLLSAGNNIYGDWKPPFQYWFGSVFVGIFSDPLVAGRLASLFMSLLGIWGIYLFAKELFGGNKNGYLAVLILALCPTALFFNIQFTAETFVFSLAPWMYWCFLKSFRPAGVRPLYILAAAGFGGLLLLSKQSGMVYLLLSMLLPLVILENGKIGGEGARKNWSGFFIGIAAVAGGLLLAMILRRLGLSSVSAELEKQFNARWLMTAGEILRLPVETWRANLASIRDYYLYYYSPFILPPILYFFFIAVRRWDSRKTIVALGFLGGSAAVILLLRGFNEYIYNTAVIVFLIPLLAMSFLAAWEAAVSAAKGVAIWRISRAAGFLVLASFTMLAAHWMYQDVLMKVSPADYIRRSTPWAKANYLENWSGGFGVAETIERLMEKQGPTVVFADPQWGNPRTALEVYLWNSQDITTISITSDFLTAEGAQNVKAYISQQGFANRLVVFSTARNEERAIWQDSVLKYFCDSREDMQVEPTQPPIAICSF